MSIHNPRKFEPEFKAKAVARVQAGETAHTVAKELDLSPSLLRGWVAKAEGRIKPKSTRKSYTDDFKHKVVQRVKSEGVAAVSRALGLSSGMVSNWAHGNKTHPRVSVKKPAKRAKKKSYYVPVSHRRAVGLLDGSTTKTERDLDRIVKTSIGLLRGIRGRLNIDDEIHLTTALVLKTLEGKM